MAKNKVYISDPSIFKDLVNAIDDFTSGNRENIKKVDDWLFEVENKLQKIKDILEQRLTDAETKLANRDMELSLCKQSINFDDKGNQIKPNCSSQEWARMRAKKQLDAAQKTMKQMEEIERHANKFTRDYDYKKQKFVDFLDNNLPGAISKLNRKDEVLINYINTAIDKYKY